jgi:hypothetical protein
VKGDWYCRRLAQATIQRPPLGEYVGTAMPTCSLGETCCGAPSVVLTGSLNAVFTAVTLLLVALLKNAELRAEAAVQSKLDALATGMLEAIRNEGQQADPMLERAIGIGEQL